MEEIDEKIEEKIEELRDLIYEEQVILAREELLDDIVAGLAAIDWTEDLYTSNVWPGKIDNLIPETAMEPTVTIPARLALLVARFLAVEEDLMRKRGQGSAMNMFGSWKRELIDAVADQCTTEEFETAAVAVRLEEGA
mgnify:CR=1 FL=1